MPSPCRWREPVCSDAEVGFHSLGWARPAERRDRAGTSLLCCAPWRLQCVAWPIVAATTKQAAFKSPKGIRGHWGGEWGPLWFTRGTEAVPQPSLGCQPQGAWSPNFMADKTPCTRDFTDKWEHRSSPFNMTFIFSFPWEQDMFQPSMVPAPVATCGGSGLQWWNCDTRGWHTGSWRLASWERSQVLLPSRDIWGWCDGPRGSF